MRVLDRYEVGPVIKRGGMATVHEALDTRLLTACAAKAMPYDPSDAEAMARFEREARLLARVSHPGLPRVVDYAIEGTTAWLVMERIEGEDLETVVEREGRLGIETVVEMARQVLDVLAYLHGEGIIYKDLKPSNVMRRPDGRVVLIDFGVATALNPHDPRNTAIGTPGYAPREQFLGKAEPRSDLYALAATMHHLLSGRPPLVPFQFEPLRRLRPEIDRALEGLVHQTLSHDPTQRFPSASMMKAALERRSPASLTAQPQVAGPAMPMVTRPLAQPQWTPAPAPRPQWTPAPAPTPTPPASTLPHGAEYTCTHCGQRVYSYGGLALQCRRCGGRLTE